MRFSPNFPREFTPTWPHFCWCSSNCRCSRCFFSHASTCSPLLTCNTRREGRVFAPPHDSNFTVSQGSPRELERAWTLARPSLRVLQVSSGEQVEACEKTARTATIWWTPTKILLSWGEFSRKIRRKIRRLHYRRTFQRCIFVEKKGRETKSLAPYRNCQLSKHLNSF